jgi:predicted DNA-binding transcriptional regulator AlpA
MRVLSKEQLKEKLGINTPKIIDELIKRDDFPRPVVFPNYAHNKWLETDIDLWLQSLPKKQRIA